MGFFGSNFSPNYNGIKWFIENVSNLIKTNIYVYGKGFIDNKKLERENVHVIGEVSDVSRMMIEVDFFISPIFEESGMKVKTCHALMYGKNIFATDESLEGYKLNDKSFVLYNTKEEFLICINEFVKNEEKTFVEEVRNDYLNKYSTDIFEKICEIMS